MNLKELRISKGFSQQNAANLLHMPLRTYKRYELEKAYENSYKYKAIFNALKSIEKSHKKVTENVFDKICIIGGGHVGLSVAKVLAKKYSVEIVDIDAKKVSSINKSNIKNIKAVGKIEDIFVKSGITRAVHTGSNKEGLELLRMSMNRLNLSARAYSRILKVARTIADLDASDDILPHHLAEAIAYRKMDRSDY